jgi:hypothetical protein
MTQLKLLSAALFAAAVIASPAMAQYHHVAPMQGSWPGTYGNHRNGVSCVSAPREGQFASEQWDNDVPCEPGTLR